MRPKRILQLFFVLLAMTTAALVVYKTIRRIKAHDNLMFRYEFRKTDTSERGYILMAPYVTSPEWESWLTILDLSGNIIFQKKVAGIVCDFRQWLVQGHIRYSYAVYDPTDILQHYRNGSVAHIVILDSALNELRQVHLHSFKEVIAEGKRNLDHRDFIMLSDEHFITMASYVMQVTNIPDSLQPAKGVRLAVPVIQEIINDTVAWQWNASAFPEFYSASMKGNNYADSSTVQDYLHIDGMALDPRDSNLVISFHNSNQVIKVKRTTGEVLWRLGGKYSDFTLSPEQIFCKQQDPSFINNGHTLLLLENGDSIIGRVSRILEFTLDEVNKKVIQFKSYNIPAAFALNKGNVQLVGDDYFICGGSANYILKVNRQTGIVNTELLYNQTSFRAYLVNDITGIPGYTKHH